MDRRCEKRSGGIAPEVKSARPQRSIASVRSVDREASVCTVAVDTFQCSLSWLMHVRQLILLMDTVLGVLRAVFRLYPVSIRRTDLLCYCDGICHSVPSFLLYGCKDDQ
jgi:hypothetical protein